MTTNTIEFCDTNIFVYAYDVTAGEKREKAKSLIERLWINGSGVVSIQVLQELFVNLVRKVARPLAQTDARAIIDDLATWRVMEPSVPDVLQAIDNSTRFRISFWDAMIITSAQRGGASIVWSEDLNDGQRYDGLLVRNPFR